MARWRRSPLLGVVVLVVSSCGPEPSSANGAQQATVVSSVATVRNTWTTATGTMAIQRWSPDGYVLVLTVPRVNDHVVSFAQWVFRGSDFPAAGTYTGAADTAPGSSFTSTDGGDPYTWEPGVSGTGSATLTLTASSASALHGTLDVNLEFTSFNATF